MNVKNLTQAEVVFLVQVMNRYSKGGAPQAEPSNLQFFSTAYVKELLQKAGKDSKLSKEGADLAKTLRSKVRE